MKQNPHFAKIKYNQELDLLKNKAENEQLKQQLKTELTEKVNSIDFFNHVIFVFHLEQVVLYLCEAAHSLMNSSRCCQANLQTELTDLKKEVSSMKITQLSEARNEQVQNL